MPGLALRLFAGLGNPGREYEQTRHNAGFWLADELARRHGGTWRSETRFNAMLAKVGIAGSDLWLVKPLGYMNRSGGVTAAVANFYRIDARDILIAHDELDLPVGDVRLKDSGGAGGHNGLKDLIAQFGDGFWRLRLGIGHPGSRDLVSGYVLNRAPASEQSLLDDATRAAADIVPVLLRDGAQPAMQKLHTRGILMGIKCGIVGLPNVGKSTLFNALTKAQIAAENYPFCTIDPNVGVVGVPDPRLAALSAIVKPEKILPTAMEFVDIAGLVAGASKGEGLGNQFLAHIRETDAIAHVVRCFEDDDIVHVSGGVNPIADADVIDTELGLADLASVEKAADRAAKLVKSGDKDAARRRDLLLRLREHLNAGNPARSLAMSDDDRKELRELHLLTIKPIMYVANVNESGFTDNPHLDAIRARAQVEGAIVVPVCAAIEAEIAQLEDSEKLDFLKDLGLDEPGLNRVIRGAYQLLGLFTYFTAGPKEVRAWTVKAGSTAPQAAGVIHTDFERGFIRAEVIGYDDYVVCKGEAGAKEAGKLRLEGKEYVVREGDVMHFRFNV